jgi:hypothetical protein
MTEEQHQKFNAAKRITCNRDEKTPKGFLMKLYRNMLGRITGVQKKKFHLYKGKEILSKEDFYNWALSNPKYFRLYREYVNSIILPNEKDC